MNRDSGALELCVLVLYRTELYNKLIYALNDAGIRGATTVSSSGMLWKKERMTIMLNTLMDQGRMMAQNELSSPNELTSR